MLKTIVVSYSSILYVLPMKKSWWHKFHKSLNKTLQNYEDIYILYNKYIYIYIYIYIYMYKWSKVIHGTQSAQIPHKQDEHNYVHLA